MFKRVIFSLLLSVALFASTQQVKALGLKYGVGAGANIASIKSYNDDINIGSGWGFQVGAHMGLDLGLIGITPEIWYTNSSAAYDASRVNGQYGTMKMEALDIPVVVSITLLGPLKLKAGPSFSIWSRSTLPDGDEFYQTKSSYGYLVGAGLEFLNIGIDVRYNGQFARAILPTGVSYSSLNPEIRANSVSIILNYSF